jgi:glycosyltransferase involved in cell wall biosynthesis
VTIRVKMHPHPDEVLNKPSGVAVVVEKYAEYLPRFDVEVVHPKDKKYDLLVDHAGATGGRALVTHNHGLYWCASYPCSDAEYRTNANVVASLRNAKIVTVPSRWVAVNIARDMHFLPRVVHHGIEWRRWRHGERVEDYVLWNKNRIFDVCHPGAVVELARRMPKQKFFTTLLQGDRPSNISVIGRLPRNEMKLAVQRAAVYLASVKETFGIGILEALAAGTPVLAFDHGGAADLVKHKVTGYLARVGDYDDLERGLRYCLSHRAELSENAMVDVTGYTWEHAARLVAQAYRDALVEEPAAVTVVIPSYNYGGKVSRAIDSALDQEFPPREVIVVDDASNDGGLTEQVVKRYTGQGLPVRYIRQASNYGVAYARNRGIYESTTKYACCLDADDAIAPEFLRVCVEALEVDRSLGVAYTGLLTVARDLRRSRLSNWPPPCDFDMQIQGRNQVPTCCVFRKEAWRRLGGYRQRYAPDGCGTEDAEFWLRVGANGWGIKKVTAKPLFNYTVGGGTTGNPNYRETNWLVWHPWVNDKQHPFASIATPERHSHPVRQYDEPDVSIVIPVGPGHVPLLVDALDSCEAQTFRNWEVIVVNDSGGLIDLTPWPYATLVETKGKQGAGFARNRGVEASKGEFIVFLDADDFLQPRFIEYMLDAYARSPNYWIYSDIYVYRDDGSVEEYACPDWDVALLWRRGIAPVTCLYTREMWERAGGMSEESYREDWDFHLRLAMAGYCGAKVPEPLMTYRHATGMRRIDGSHRKEIKVIHATYDLEELKMACRGCGKRRRTGVNRTTNPEPPRNWQAKEELGWPIFEFTGGNINSLKFKGKSGRTYIAGNNQYHRRIRVHPDDERHFERLTYFRRFVPLQAEDTLVAQTRPEAPTPVVAKPAEERMEHEVAGDGRLLGDRRLDDLSVSDIQQIDFIDEDIPTLIEEEKSRPKPRSTVIRILERWGRKQDRLKEKADG